MRTSTHVQPTLAFRTFSFDTEGAVLFTHDITGKRQPAYSISKPRLPKQHTKVLRISGPNWNPTAGEVGAFRVHSVSSSIDIELQGRTSRIRRAGKWRTRHAFEWPPLGELEWKEKSSGRELHLIDETGRSLTRCVSRNTYIGERIGKIEVLVPGDDHFVDMCVVTSLARWRDQELAMQAAMSG